MTTDINTTNFATEVIGSSVPVVVDFWAPWCGHCVAQTPILENFEQAVGSAVKVCKVNTDQNRELAAQYGIMSIPTILVFKDGKLVTRAVGTQSVENLKKLTGIL